jgi:hypothetical protein
MMKNHNLPSRADRTKLSRKLSMFCVALLAGTPLFGQSDSAPTAQGTISYSAAASDAQGASDLQQQNPYLGGVPAGKASSTALSLPLDDAVSRGLRQNLGGLLSSDALSGARGERWRTLSALLPNLTTATSFSVRQIDVRSLIGINNVPGHPPVLGPFVVFDTRAYLDQSVFDWQSIESARSSAAQVKSAQCPPVVRAVGHTPEKLALQQLAQQGSGGDDYRPANSEAVGFLIAKIHDQLKGVLGVGLSLKTAILGCEHLAFVCSPSGSKPKGTVSHNLLF